MHLAGSESEIRRVARHNPPRVLPAMKDDMSQLAVDTSADVLAVNSISDDTDTACGFCGGVKPLPNRTGSAFEIGWLVTTSLIRWIREFCRSAELRLLLLVFLAALALGAVKQTPRPGPELLARICCAWLVGSHRVKVEPAPCSRWTSM